MDWESHDSLVRPLRRRAGVAFVTQIVAAVASLAAIVSDALEIELLRIIGSGQYVPEAVLYANDNRQMAIYTVYTLAALAAAILLFTWLHKAYANLHQSGTSDLRFTPGWAIGWFFIPLANLFKPYQAVSDLWKASRWGPSSSWVASWRDLPGSPVVPLWWGLWLVAILMGYVAMVMTPAGAEIDEWIAYDYVYMASNAISAVSFLLTAYLIRSVTRFQTDRTMAETSDLAVFAG